MHKSFLIAKCKLIIVCFFSSPLFSSIFLTFFTCTSHIYYHYIFFLNRLASPGFLFADISPWHNMKQCWEIKNWSLLSTGLLSLLLVGYERERDRQKRERQSVLWEDCKQKLFQGFCRVKVSEESEKVEEQGRKKCAKGKRAL